MSVDFVVEDVRQGRQRSFAALRMTEGSAQDDRGEGLIRLMLIWTDNDN